MNQARRIAFHTLGCKLNFSETASISRRFGGEHFREVDFREVADLYVIHSCTVTANAEKRCRELIRKAHRSNPEAHIAVIGCYAQLESRELAAMPGVSIVLGNADKYALYEHAERLFSETASGHGAGADTDLGPAPQDTAPALQRAGRDVTLDGEPGAASGIHGIDDFVPTWSIEGRTRSFFKIQDGCDYHCAYCTIPLARGKSRSNTIEATLEAARHISGSEIREMVLTGVNIGDFGKVHGENLFQLLWEMARMEGLPRIRLSSIEPDLLRDDIIRLVAREPSLMPHFHIPLQSGSDSILRAMGRRYGTALFADRVRTIRQHIPHACIAADIIVGYPGETEALFRESIRTIEALDISYLHVFTYSQRKNTRAYGAAQAVSPADRKKRSQLMQELSREKKSAFILANRGRTERILWEKEAQGGHMHGFTENYLRAKTPHDPKRVNTIESHPLNTTDINGVYLI